jgi:hypothetical protein
MATSNKNIVVKAGNALPWFQRFIFIIFIAKGRRKINLWNQGTAGLQCIII